MQVTTAKPTLSHSSSRSSTTPFSTTWPRRRASCALSAPVTPRRRRVSSCRSADCSPSCRRSCARSCVRAGGGERRDTERRHRARPASTRLAHSQVCRTNRVLATTTAAATAACPSPAAESGRRGQGAAASAELGHRLRAIGTMRNNRSKKMRCVL